MKPETVHLPPFTTVVLAGGNGVRLGADKASVLVGGVSMLARVAAATVDADQVIVAGDVHGPDRPGVRWVRESPPHGGPVAGLAAALGLVRTPVTVVLAVDVPLVDAGVVRWLREALAAGRGSAVVPLDSSGRRQPLVACYDTAALRVAMADIGMPTGRAMRDVLVRMDVVELAAGAGSVKLMDVDTPEDLAAARLHAWTADMASDLGVPLDAETVSAVITQVLDIARDVAHGVARPAAPVTTFLVGLAVADALGQVPSGDRPVAVSPALTSVHEKVIAALATYGQLRADPEPGEVD